MGTTKQLPTRAAVPVSLTWDLTPIYATTAAYEADVTKIKETLTTVTALKTNFNDSATTAVSYTHLTLPTKA